MRVITLKDADTDTDLTSGHCRNTFRDADVFKTCGKPLYVAGRTIGGKMILVCRYGCGHVEERIPNQVRCYIDPRD